MDDKIFKSGYFVLYSNDGKIYNNLIEHQQLKYGFPPEDARFTHIELYLGEKYSINAVFPKIKINKDICKKHSGRYIKLLRPRIKYYDQKRKDLAIHGVKRVGKPYGMGIFWFLVRNKLKRNIFSVIGDFCTELAGWLILKTFKSENESYNKYIPVEYDQLMPADFSFHKDYFEVIWEGYIE